jgi:hypothetical protein
MRRDGETGPGADKGASYLSRVILGCGLALPSIN